MVEMISPLIIAAADNDVKRVNRLLNRGRLNVNETSPKDDDDLYIDRGDTALMLAVKNHNYDIVVRLLEAGADVNIKSIDGNTALHLATLIGYAQNPNSKHIIKALVDISGVELNTFNNAGHTPLINAVSVPYSFDIDVVKILLDAGADVNIRAAPVNNFMPGGYTALDKVLSEIRSLRRRAEQLRYDVDVELEERLKQVALLLISYGARSMQPDISMILSHQSIKDSLMAGAYGRRRNALLAWGRKRAELEAEENEHAEAAAAPNATAVGAGDAAGGAGAAAAPAPRENGAGANKGGARRHSLKKRKASTTRRRRRA